MKASTPAPELSSSILDAIGNTPRLHRWDHFWEGVDESKVLPFQEFYFILLGPSPEASLDNKYSESAIVWW